MRRTHPYVALILVLASAAFVTLLTLSESDGSHIRESKPEAPTDTLLAAARQATVQARRADADSTRRFDQAAAAAKIKASNLLAAISQSRAMLQSAKRAIHLKANAAARHAARDVREHTLSVAAAVRDRAVHDATQEESRLSKQARAREAAARRLQRRYRKETKKEAAELQQRLKQVVTAAKSRASLEASSSLSASARAHQQLRELREKERALSLEVKEDDARASRSRRAAQRKAARKVRRAVTSAREEAARIAAERDARVRSALAHAVAVRSRESVAKRHVKKVKAAQELRFEAAGREAVTSSHEVDAKVRRSLVARNMAVARAAAMRVVHKTQASALVSLREAGQAQRAAQAAHRLKKLAQHQQGLALGASVMQNTAFPVEVASKTAMGHGPPSVLSQGQNALEKLALRRALQRTIEVMRSSRAAKILPKAFLSETSSKAATAAVAAEAPRLRRLEAKALHAAVVVAAKHAQHIKNASGDPARRRKQVEAAAAEAARVAKASLHHAEEEAAEQVARAAAAGARSALRSAARHAKREAQREAAAHRRVQYATANITQATARTAAGQAGRDLSKYAERAEATADKRIVGTELARVHEFRREAHTAMDSFRRQEKLKLKKFVKEEKASAVRVQAAANAYAHRKIDAVKLAAYKERHAKSLVAAKHVEGIEIARLKSATSAAQAASRLVKEREAALGDLKKKRAVAVRAKERNTKARASLAAATALKLERKSAPQLAARRAHKATLAVRSAEKRYRELAKKEDALVLQGGKVAIAAATDALEAKRAVREAKRRKSHLAGRSTPEHAGRGDENVGPKVVMLVQPADAAAGKLADAVHNVQQQVQAQMATMTSVGESD